LGSSDLRIDAPVQIVGFIGLIKPADSSDIPREFSALLAAQCENARLPMDHACPSPGAASAA